MVKGKQEISVLVIGDTEDGPTGPAVAESLRAVATLIDHYGIPDEDDGNRGVVTAYGESPTSEATGQAKLASAPDGVTVIRYSGKFAAS